MNSKQIANTPNVPDRIFSQFLEELEASDVPKEVSSRLRETLLERKKFTDAALKAAVLGDES
jgi:hypothetical protein